MSEQIRVTGDDTLVDGGTTVVAEDPAVVRSQIERTRQRMSSTIDEIEDALLRKKGEIQERLDFTAPIRERPLASAGIALGAGLMLGFLTGGDDDDDRPHRSAADGERRAELWEDRARRLLRIAQEQEEELQRLRGGTGRLPAVEWHDGPAVPLREHAGEAGGGRTQFHDLRDGLVTRLGDYLTGAVHDLMGTKHSV